MITAHIIIANAPKLKFCEESWQYWCKKVLTWCTEEKVEGILVSQSYKVSCFVPRIMSRTYLSQDYVCILSAGVESKRARALICIYMLCAFEFPDSVGGFCTAQLQYHS